MKTISELTAPDKLKEFSIESNHRLGNEIFRYDHIDFQETKPDHVIARVKVPTGQTRKVELIVKDDVLTWTCTCGSASGKDDDFCKHAVATTLKLAETD